MVISLIKVVIVSQRHGDFTAVKKLAVWDGNVTQFKDMVIEQTKKTVI